MEPISFIIISTSGTTVFSFAGAVEEQIEALNIIGGNVLEWYDGSCHKKMLLYDAALIAKIDDFANKFGSKDNKQPFELRKFMKKHLQKDEPFYMFRIARAIKSTEQIDVIHAIYQLQAKKLGKPIDELWDLVKIDFEQLMAYYTVTTYGTEDLRIGSSADDRVCRFCGRSKADGATFDNDSHAISEALGNKTLICNEECDDCNTRLELIESNLSVAYLEIRRALCGIQGKKGINSVAGQNFLMDSKTHQMVINSNAEVKVNGDTIQVKLEGREIFTMEGVYKALAKIVIDLVDTKQVLHFHNTIDWINGKLTANEYPPIKQYYSSTIAHQPIVELYIRKNENDATVGPYCFANLFVCDLVLQFVVPFVDVDCGKMKTAEMIAPFESKMGASLKIYNFKYEYLDSGNKEQRTAWTILEYGKSGLKQNSNPVKVSDKLHILPPKWEQDTITYPPFDSSIVKTEEVKLLQVTDIDRSIQLTDDWLHDTSNNIGGTFVLDELGQKVLLDIKIEMCNTDNSQHLFTSRVAKQFTISNIYSVYNKDEQGCVSILKEFMIYLTALTLIDLSRKVQSEICPKINLLQLDLLGLCDHYKLVFARLD